MGQEGKTLLEIIIVLAILGTASALAGPNLSSEQSRAQLKSVTEELASERIKREFTATLSHELRTPLTSIIGSLQLINSGFAGELRPELAELTAVAERNGVRLLDLINDLLDIEKIQSGTFPTASTYFLICSFSLVLKTKSNNCPLQLEN